MDSRELPKQPPMAIVLVFAFPDFVAHPEVKVSILHRKRERVVYSLIIPFYA